MKIKSEIERECGKPRSFLKLGTFDKASFIGRPNRFLVRCRLEDSSIVDAYLPNPGRLRELLLPGATLYVKHRPAGDQYRQAARKTEWTALAVERDGVPFFLHTHLTNQVARHLIEGGRIPGLEGAEIVDAEVTVGNSRFDFLIRVGDRETYLEVKSCTLLGNGVAMFPDAVTERGTRHLLELASLNRQGVPAMVLFVVHSRRARWFMPDYHTDLPFSQALLKVRNDLAILPVAIEWRRDLSLTTNVSRLEIPWDFLAREVKDRGSYLLILELAEDKQVDCGGLGRRHFRRGFYIYVGSAMQNLSARIARHMRRRKRHHWHIDYLRQHADRVQALPIRSSQRQECEVARAISEISEPGPAGFGSSDCSCPTHLHWFPSEPLESESFHAFLQSFRMIPPCSS